MDCLIISSSGLIIILSLFILNGNLIMERKGCFFTKKCYQPKAHDGNLPDSLISVFPGRPTMTSVMSRLVRLPYNICSLFMYLFKQVPNNTVLVSS